MIETNAAGWGEGGCGAAIGLEGVAAGAYAPANKGDTARQSFMPVLAATGMPPSLITDADGPSQRESSQVAFEYRPAIGAAAKIQVDHEAGVTRDAESRSLHTGYG